MPIRNINLYHRTLCKTLKFGEGVTSSLDVKLPLGGRASFELITCMYTVVHKWCECCVRCVVNFLFVCVLQCCLFHPALMSCCFCSINVTHYAALAGAYYGWSTPYNYLDVYQMQLDTNVLVNGTCLASNDTYDMVVCPSGSYKLPESDIEGLCKQRNLPCLAVSQTVPRALAAAAAIAAAAGNSLYVCCACLLPCLLTVGLCW